MRKAGLLWTSPMQPFRGLWCKVFVFFKLYLLTVKTMLVVTTLLCTIRNDDSLQSGNLVTGCQKCGITPLNRNEASNRLHRTCTPELANSDVAIVNTNVSDGVESALRAVRRGLGTAQLSRKAGRRILFAPQRTCFGKFLFSQIGDISHVNCVQILPKLIGPTIGRRGHALFGMKDVGS